MQRLLLSFALSAALSAQAACAPSQVATPAKSSSPFDQQFIDMMVPHHEAAVEMARVAQQRSQRPEIKTLADDIIRGQSDEVGRMKQWRKAWYGSDQTPPLSKMPMVEGMQMRAGGGHNAHGGAASPTQTMDMQQEVEVLKKASEPFDKAFIDAMIPHHEDAIAAAKAAADRAQRQEIKDLAQAIIRDQEREISQMKEWRQAWFPG